MRHFALRIIYREEKKYLKATNEWWNCSAEKLKHYYYCQDLHHIIAYNSKLEKVKTIQDCYYFICNTDICIALRSDRSAGKEHTQ